MFYDSGKDTGVNAGRGTPLTQQDLKISTLYETVGSPVIQHTMTINSIPEYLVFLKTKEGDLKAYRLEVNPPPCFIVIRDEQDKLEFLPRPLPEEQPSPGEAKQPSDKAPGDTKIEAAPSSPPPGP